jgi:excisionase family DNA binding protein
VTQDKQNPSVFQRIQLYTVGEAAAALHLHPSTLRRVIRRGDLPVVRIGAAIRIHPQDLLEFTDARRFRRVVSALRSGSWAKVMGAWEKYESES